MPTVSASTAQRVSSTPPLVQIEKRERVQIEFDNRIFRHEAKAVLGRLFLYLRIIGKHLTARKLFNFICVELDYFFARPQCWGKPWSAKIEPTNICNLQCTYCPRDEAPYGLGSMSLENFQLLIDEIKNHTFLIAIHLWGEPLLHKKLPTMIRYASENGIGTYVSSNFNILSDRQARELIESRLDLLTVCVDGADQETYEVFRKGGAVSKVLKNVERFIEIRREMRSSTPHVEMQFLITPKTEKEIPRVRELARQIGVDSFKPKPVYPIMVERNGTFFMPAGEQYHPQKRRARRKACWWLWRTITIGWDGSVLPCCRVMFASSIGNVFQKPLAELWNSGRYQELRRTFARGEKGASPCNVCHVPYGSMHG